MPTEARLKYFKAARALRDAKDEQHKLITKIIMAEKEAEETWAAALREAQEELGSVPDAKLHERDVSVRGS